MKRKLAIMTTVGIAAGLVSGCGGGGSSQGQTGSTTSTTPPTSNVQSLDTTEVLGQAELPTETGTPYAVNDGHLVLTDTSETSAPIVVNGM